MAILSESVKLQEVLEPYPVVTRVPVQWAEMDALQHVNNVRYLQWVEAGRMDYFGQIDWINIEDNPHKVGPILSSTECKYVFPLTYPDVVLIGTRCTRVAEDRFFMETLIASEKYERTAAINEAIIVTYDYQNREKAQLPPSLRNAILELEMKIS